MLGKNFPLLGISVSVNGFFYALAFSASCVYLFYRTSQFGLTFWQKWLLVVCTTLLAGLGASTLSVLEFHEPLRKILDRSGGSSFLGGYLLVLPALLIYARLLKLHLLRFMDVTALAWALGYGIGRLACFFTGDGCYGIPTDSWLGMAFPNGVIPSYVPVYPTPLFESAAALLIFGIFYSRYERRPSQSWLPGRIFYGASSWMFLERFAVEFIRHNPKYAGLSLAQWISAPLIVVYSVLNVLLEPRLHDAASAVTVGLNQD